MATASANGLLNVMSTRLATLPMQEIKKAVIAPSLIRTGALTAVIVALIDICYRPRARHAKWPGYGSEFIRAT